MTTHQDVVTVLGRALDLTLDRATAAFGPDVADYIPVFKRGVEILVKFIRERGHKETLHLLDLLAAMPPEKL